jgi:hypothetical protein
MKKFENMTINQLKDEYVNLALGAMCFGSKTEQRRKEISKEIDRRESLK